MTKPSRNFVLKTSISVSIACSVNHPVIYPPINAPAIAAQNSLDVISEYKRCCQSCTDPAVLAVLSHPAQATAFPWEAWPHHRNELELRMRVPVQLKPRKIVNS